MKGTHKKVCLLLIVVLICSLSACSSESSADNKVSKEAEKIIQAMMTCPNENLYSSSSATVIGEGVGDEEVNAMERKDDADRISENWKKEVGDCFSEGAIDDFLQKGLAQSYFAEAEKENVEIKVKEISLAGKEEYTETANVTYLKGEQEEKATLLFTLNSDGLVTNVEPAG